MELALVLAALSPLDRDTQNSLRRDTPYFREVETHFAPFATMEAVTALGDSFNLPRLAVNAADFAFDDTGALVEVDASGSLWGDTEGDLFRRHREAIAAFAEASGFRDFHAAHRSAHDEVLEATRAMVDPARMQTWLEANFSARPGPMRVYVSPLMSGFHWTTLFKPEQRIWINGPRPARVAGASAVDRMRYARAVFTELDHAYVNPVTAQMTDGIEKAFASTATWANERAAQNYATAELQFNEYMTFAVFLMYAADQMAEEQFQAVADSVHSLMERSRGFVAFESFASEALARYRQGDATAEQLIPQMIDWSAAHTTSESP